MKWILLLCFISVSCTSNNTQKRLSLLSNDIQRIQNTPNIILILGDDIGYEIPAYTGGQSYATPKWDLLASQSRQYPFCYTLPLCSPSRTALFTGLYNFRNYTHWGKLDISNVTIANVLKDNGYATAIAGKWQMGGGDASLKKFGFDRYSVWLPFTDDESESSGGSHYKNPIVYQDGSYLPTSFTTGRYGEDIFRNYLFNFMDSNASAGKPFFATLTLNLLHSPFQPTPFDSVFLKTSGGNNPIWFPSMVKYLDYEIGLIQAKVDSIPNTVLIFIGGDNGTENTITSLFNGRQIIGGKNKTDETGTRVAMLLHSSSGTYIGIDSNMVELVDFLPTIAGLTGCNLTIPTDGLNFLTQQRSWIFQHFQSKGIDSPQFRFMRWVQNKVYKTYDTVTSIPVQAKTGNFYRVFTNTYGQSDKLLTPTTVAEKRNDSIFKLVLQSLK